MSHTQDHRMRAVLLRLELVSHGSTQAWNASGGHSGEPDDRVVELVRREPKYEHLEYRKRYKNAGSDQIRETIILEAEEEVQRWTVRTAPMPEETPSLEDVIILDGKGHDAEIVAGWFRVDPAFVRRLRKRRNRSVEDGREITAGPVVDPALRAVELRAQGLSTRKIADMLDTHQTQVMRWIRKSAA